MSLSTHVGEVTSFLFTGAQLHQGVSGEAGKGRRWLVSLGAEQDTLDVPAISTSHLMATCPWKETQGMKLSTI